MPNRNSSLVRKILIACAGIASVTPLVVVVVLLVWVSDCVQRTESEPAVRVSAPPASVSHFTLRLGQGLRFKDCAVVVAKPDQGADIVFRYLPPQAGGRALRYNPVSQQVETAMEPMLTSPVPLLLAAHVNAFDEKPNVAHITTADAASYQNQSPIFSNTRYVLVMTAANEHYLLTLEELQAPPGKYDDWRIGFTYEKVQLAPGLEGSTRGK